MEKWYYVIQHYANKMDVCEQKAIDEKELPTEEDQG